MRHTRWRRRPRYYRQTVNQRVIAAAANSVRDKVENVRSIPALRLALKKIVADEKLWTGFKAMEQAAQILGQIDW